MTDTTRRASQAETTDLRTRSGERIYDLDPLASTLWAIAGPDGLDPKTVNIDDLPAGCRWLENDEWGLASAITGYPDLHCPHCALWIGDPDDPDIADISLSHDIDACDRVARKAQEKT